MITNYPLHILPRGYTIWLEDAIAYIVNTSDEFDAWWERQENDLQDAIATHVGLLKEYGPILGRPYADHLERQRSSLVTSQNWRTEMAKPFERLIDNLPAERRERIEAQTQALVQEYELLKALRKDLDVSQETLAALMGIRQASLSKIENQDDMLVSTLRKYVEALGGELEIKVHLKDHDVTLKQFSQAGA